MNWLMMTMMLSVRVSCEADSAPGGSGVVLPFVKYLHDRSLLTLYRRLFAGGLPAAHAPAVVPFPLPVSAGDRRGGPPPPGADTEDPKMSSSSSSSVRFRPYVLDAALYHQRRLHAAANHR